MGTMARVNPDKSLSPFTIISTALDQTITDIKAELGPSTKVKVFVTGTCAMQCNLLSAFIRHMCDVLP